MLHLSELMLNTVCMRPRALGWRRTDNHEGLSDVFFVAFSREILCA